ncbi:MAG: formylglycine-generating enzyme family protein [Deltaproteobacteria bacterium]|nr:formylglycine-generating enzyme family protein [Deltaproteobacteria bacterium]
MRLCTSAMACAFLLSSCSSSIDVTCEPDCSGRECGPDPSCGESCGACGAHATCTEGQCVCDYLACGELCCAEGESCIEGACVQDQDPCEPNPCTQEHKTQCVADGAGGALCSCDPDYEDYGDGSCRPSDPCAGDTACADQHRECSNDQGTAVCGDCVAGYHDEAGACVSDESCLTNTCSGHGVCDDSSGVPVCTCDEGYAGDYCDACDEANGWHWSVDGDACTKDPCDPNPCTEEHKTQCADDGYGVAICSCDPGYEDYGDGSCRLSDPCAGDTTCAEQHRECTNDQGTAVCGDCSAGYHEEAGVCAIDVSCQTNTCSGRGACDDSSGVPVCSCDEGYAGDHCDGCDEANGWHWNAAGDACTDDPCDPNPCTEPHETQCADDGSGSAICSCDPGYQDYGDGACRPSDPCAGDTTCASQHRECVNDQGYPVCGDCVTSYHEEAGTCVENIPCQVDTCSGHGACDDSSGVPVCTCDEGYAGDYCDACADGYEDFGSGCVLFWISISGGAFLMGSDAGETAEMPVHQVTVPSFEMTRTEVTVGQYRYCVDNGVCIEPDDYTVNFYCNWGQTGRDDHPVNCVDWNQALVFCEWVGGRLPSEAEWEYAARSGGQDITYPWGEDAASCEYAVMDEGVFGCGEDRTWPVCSKTAGNTLQGLCDMAGNVWEWVQDCRYLSYDGAPEDGSAWEGCASDDYRVFRGGSFINHDSHYLRTSHRAGYYPSFRRYDKGFRCAK